MAVKLLVNAFVALTLSLQAQALTIGAKKLVEYETKANGAGVRSSQMIPLPHVEIPLEMVGLDFARRLDPKIAQSLVFEKNGRKYVRWILNPEDTKWGQELLKYYADQGLQLQVKYHFQGYQTASRSYIAEDPTNGAQFSVKSSTNVTGGAWRDKKQPIGEAIDGRITSDFLAAQQKQRKFENFIFMDEPAIMKIDALDQAVVIRDLNALNNEKSGKIYLPGFSALHAQVGNEIALKNGSNDPAAFWSEHYIKVAGRALGELAARTGIQFDSPHSQNFLVELDANYKPTGRLVLRDMSDLYLDVNFMNALLGPENRVLKGFTQKENLLNHIAAGFGPLHGNTFPDWVSQEKYDSWKATFFEAFEKTFQDISGYDIAQLNEEKGRYGDYFGASYQLADKPAYSPLFESMKKAGVVKTPALRCQMLFTGS